MKEDKSLRTDRDGKFLFKQFNVFCDENIIRRILTVPYTPEKNGVAD